MTTLPVTPAAIAAWGRIANAAGPDEDTPSAARSRYGITKHTNERFCQRDAERIGLDIVSVCPVSGYGPMERVTPGYEGGHRTARDVTAGRRE